MTAAAPELVDLKLKCAYQTERDGLQTKLRLCISVYFVSSLVFEFSRPHCISHFCVCFSLIHMMALVEDGDAMCVRQSKGAMCVYFVLHRACTIEAACLVVVC